MSKRWMFVWAFLALAPADSARAEAPVYERRWFYSATNLQVDEAADELIALTRRAAKAGYNGLMLADYKLNILDRVPDRYFANVRRLREAAEAEEVEIIPAVFPIGYSSGLLAHDPNLAEGMPVEAAPFVVRGGEARPIPPAAPLYGNGGMEDARGDRLDGFAFQDDPGAGSFVDGSVFHSGGRSLRLEAKGGSPNRRAIRTIAVEPRRVYRFSAWVKAEGLRPAASFRLLILGAGEGGRALTFFEGGVASDQDWKRVEVVFNSLDQTKVNAYIGLWAPSGGRVWVDDVAVEPMGLANVLRRDGCPLVVTSDDGRTTYEEGRDFEPVSDPKLGRVPWDGEYSFSHDGPPVRVSAGGRIRDGQKLRVSWHHPVAVHGSQVMCCPSDPKVETLLRDQARRVNELFRPRTFFMSHDEIRCLNWDRSCLDRGLTSGEILADNVKRCAAILEEVAPGCQIVVWSDMFDPTHNAVAGPYYLVNGTLEGSWLGLPPRVTVANWNSGKAAESLAFFADRGHRQILAGYYDVDDLSGFTRWDAAARGVRGVDGFMYTTWERKYWLLEEYGRAMAGRPTDDGRKTL
ncbi:carbohydrate binding domain-containing protein [Paludisphaera sp.]|uniref:carbohydrate binding domain-containing protein n=1 Tax=Paludisphaera sp. TaxID=2017432 RepID=UPI00301E0578